MALTVFLAAKMISAAARGIVSHKKERGEAGQDQGRSALGRRAISVPLTPVKGSLTVTRG
jgi:hypothetical protein